ncbi:LAMI_0F02718g1_1 [Lachancea mirantina]|uniref:Large ribosomal subunit protein mL46 n=1 Tax=Lachancea mirantina TaxID=1230905 RepID=A0A1G4JWQ4_9SACH|nr:LAMI_0F02718g1_1 [Lachancea mirantina]
MALRNLIKRGLATSATPPNVKAGIIISRTPIVTKELSKLESQYYEYQSELERRLMWTFPQYFYYKKGTLAERRFLALQKGPVSKQPGVWFPKGVPDVRHNRERRIKQDIKLPSEASVGSEGDGSSEDLSRPITPNSRVTEADRKGDLTSLERSLSRTLYLLLKRTNGEWAFPSFKTKSDHRSNENLPLHDIAEHGLRSIGGENINTWTVSRTPAAVLADSKTAEFFIKSHIVAGKFVLQNTKEYTGFAWLTKEEIQNHVQKPYFEELSCLLSDV